MHNIFKRLYTGIYKCIIILLLLLLLFHFKVTLIVISFFYI